MDDDRTQPSGPGRPPDPADPERSWRGLAVGLAVGIAVLLLLMAVAVATRGEGDDENENETATSTSVSGVTVSSAITQSTPSVTGRPSETGGPPTTRRATPLAIVAADERRVVVLDQSGSAAPRTLFDLGPSTSADEQPPIIGGVSLSGDGRTAYFDVVGMPAASSMNQVPVAGGPKQEIGRGVAPVPSPDGALLASIDAPEPDVPATLVVRPLSGGAERRFDLGDGSCGNLSWSPNRAEVAADICSGGEPVTVVVVDVATGGVRPLTAPEGTTWSVPAFKADGTLTLVEQRENDAAVVALRPDRGGVATTVFRRPSTSINTIDWSAAGDLLVCDVDGIVVGVVGGKAQQVATGFTSAAW